MHKNVESLCCTSEANIILYNNYSLIKRAAWIWLVNLPEVKNQQWAWLQGQQRASAQFTVQYSERTWPWHQPGFQWLQCHELQQKLLPHSLDSRCTAIPSPFVDILFHSEVEVGVTKVDSSCKEFEDAFLLHLQGIEVSRHSLESEIPLRSPQEPRTAPCGTSSTWQLCHLLEWGDTMEGGLPGERFKIS